MFSSPVGLFILSMFFGGVCGAIGYIIGRRRSTSPEVTRSVNSSKAEILNEKAKIETFVTTLHDLTTDVHAEVGEHSSRVNEITLSLDASKANSPEVIHSAGKSLVAANMELQAALANAKVEIEKQRDELRRSISESRTDGLTGLPNRRAFDHEIGRSVAAFRRKATPFCLVMLDIDRFKQLNDTHGHLLGDQVLKAFARCLGASFRETDFVGRYGGEEFAAILPQTSLCEALIAAERSRHLIATSPFVSGAVEITVTASIGIKEIASGETVEEMIKKADAALYAAKKGGRNCCYYHDGAATLKVVPQLESSTDSISHTDNLEKSSGNQMDQGAKAILVTS